MKQKNFTKHHSMLGFARYNSAPGFAPIVILLVVIALGIVGYFSYQMFMVQKVQNTGKVLPLPTSIARQTAFPVFAKTPVPSLQPISNLPKKYFTSSDKMFTGQQYPQELLGHNDSKLFGFSCSGKYQAGDGTYVYNDGTNVQTLSDSALINYLNTLDKDIKSSSPRSSLYTVTICNLENNNKLVYYEVTPGGGGAGSSVYFGYFSGGKINPVSVVPIENGPYFSCGKILAITKTNYLFADCGSGDGGFGSESIYKVNLNSDSTATLLLKCTALSDLSGNGPYPSPAIKCGTTQ